MLGVYRCPFCIPMPLGMNKHVNGDAFMFVQHSCIYPCQNMYSPSSVAKDSLIITTYTSVHVLLQVGRVCLLISTNFHSLCHNLAKKRIIILDKSKEKLEESWGIYFSHRIYILVQINQEYYLWVFLSNR